MGIARQIRQHRRRPGEGVFGIDYPLALAQRREPVGGHRRIGQRGVLAEELQLAAHQLHSGHQPGLVGRDREEELQPRNRRIERDRRGAFAHAWLRRRPLRRTRPKYPQRWDNGCVPLRSA